MDDDRYRLDKYTFFDRFEYEGTECIVAGLWLPSVGDYTVGYAKVPKDHGDFGIQYFSDDFPDIYNLTCREVTFTGPRDGEDWWIGFDTAHYGDDTSIEYAESTVRALAYAIMCRANA